MIPTEPLCAGRVTHTIEVQKVPSVRGRSPRYSSDWNQTWFSAVPVCEVLSCDRLAPLRCQRGATWFAFLLHWFETYAGDEYGTPDRVVLSRVSDVSKWSAARGTSGLGRCVSCSDWHPDYTNDSITICNFFHNGMERSRDVHCSCLPGRTVPVLATTESSHDLSTTCPCDYIFLVIWDVCNRKSQNECDMEFCVRLWSRLRF